MPATKAHEIPKRVTHIIGEEIKKVAESFVAKDREDVKT